MKQRDIVLVPFPFSDQTGQKVRPALILSNNDFNRAEDLIACAVTSNLKLSKYALVIDQRDIENGVLYDASAIKIENIFKIKKSLVIKNIVTIKKATFSKAIFILSELVKVS